MTPFRAFIIAAREELATASPATREIIRAAIEREIIRESMSRAEEKAGLAPRSGEAILQALKDQEKH